MYIYMVAFLLLTTQIASLKLKLFHGTLLSYAQSILATNNCNAIRPSLSGHMGAGIYLAREDKAAHFARDASERGLGFGPGIVFKCQVLFHMPR